MDERVCSLMQEPESKGHVQEDPLLEVWRKVEVFGKESSQGGMEVLEDHHRNGFPGTHVYSQQLHYVWVT